MDARADGLATAVTNADAVIAAYRSGFDDLAGLVARLSDDDLARTSAADRWTIAQVLSHLGSGAEISQAVMRAALAGEPHPGQEFTKSVWARWDAMPAREQADTFVTANKALAELYESLDSGARENLRVDVGFMPAPVDVATTVQLRLSELTLHSWDVRVTFDPGATLPADATALLLQGTLPLSWIGKADALGGRTAVVAVTTTEPSSAFALRLEDPVSVGALPDDADADGTLALPAEAWVRLVAGRLGAGRTTEGVRVTGAADLDLLRRVFPGY
jgi:uncharacterized protein (TIGR03083 family)